MRPSFVGSLRQVFSFILIFGAFARPVGQFDTGKIEGKVRDQAGAPIANAQVTIVGTSFSALTNRVGYYFFNNVPVGVVSVRAAFVGYKSTEVQDVRVLSGQTVTQDIQLEQSPFQVDEITILSAAAPLVPRDQVTTKQRLDGTYVDGVPVTPGYRGTGFRSSDGTNPAVQVGTHGFEEASVTTGTS